MSATRVVMVEFRLDVEAMNPATHRRVRTIAAILRMEHLQRVTMQVAG